MSPDDAAALKNLDKIDHIVVLMMENRSFDHMLGYLKLEGGMAEVEGLQAEMGAKDSAGREHKVKPLGSRMLHHKVLDPGHGADDVKLQLDPNVGFVQSYERSLEKNMKKHPVPDGFVLDPTRILGYQQAGDVPVYDFMARNFTICDHWFSSVPGPTWPNRNYAVAGKSEGATPPELLGQVPDLFKGLPVYDLDAFVHQLDDSAWRWYSHDPATLRLVDSSFRPGGAKGTGNDDNFAYFNRRTLFERKTFLDDAEDGNLRNVSWIDPNFVDFRFGPPGSNDDHPPSRVLLGQELVLTALHAVTASPQWPKTLFLVVYDEHGGFYDHVDPRDFEVPGDPDHHYGVRVPALVASPFVEQGGVSHVPFDHTSIIKTILLKFSKDPEAALAAMGPRTASARHLGELLTGPEDAGTDPPPLGGVIDELRETKLVVHDWEQTAAAEKAFEGLTDLQKDIVFTSLEIRSAGKHPPGKP